ncbi:Neugrin/Rrg9 [Cinara cedri]|uniref:Neugrin/Rrg9 n=1 Tax=Cinara cedri TaxID=506608 RepID=A0A5E4MXW0_9HEMI|nr:Neugrin/Rrg9 [Cinara cedri]
MFSRNILYLKNSVRSSFLSRTYRNVKAKPVKQLKNDNVKGNPGGNRMIALILDGEAPDMSNVTLEDIENGENDLLNSHLFYDQHMNEIKQQRKFKSFQNIKRKYFKNNAVQTNFLTYFEKQQIKNLHEKSPKEWTPETLSTCFPATPEIIVKILKSKWIADEGQKILRHDRFVQQNWERFRNGLFKDILSNEHKNHLTKFSDRRPTLITLEQAEAFISKPASDFLKREEFGQIITSYLGEPSDQNELTQIETKEEPHVERIYEDNTITDKSKKHFTLDDIKNNSQNKSFKWYMPQTLQSNEKSVDIATVEASLQENTSVISRKEVSTYIDTMNDYPLAIRIPKQVWKEGYMYKVKDCFYDDNGDFLYRVPGLITDGDSQQKCKN